MKTVRSLIRRDVVWSVFFVALAFMSLFFFIGFLEELEGATRRGDSLWRAALAAGLELPSRFYELFPISVLIGTIYAMARLAQSSEFTILRTGGLGPGRALSLLLNLGLLMAALTFLTGEFIAPLGELQASRMRASGDGQTTVGEAGAWLKERRHLPDGDRVFSINVQGTDSQGDLHGIRIFEHDDDGRLLRRIEAASGHAGREGEQSVWQLRKARETVWPLDEQQPVITRSLESLNWNTTLDDSVVAAATSPIGSMSTLELWRYSQHLTLQEQTSQRYELQFWKRAIYPFACIVMMALALPFAYLHARAGGISLKVFGGIMLGISFVLLNNVVGHLTLLRDWTPWLAASVPSLIYLALSLAAFGWLVRYR